MKLPCKKRYIIGGLLVAFMLYKCSGPDEDEQYAEYRHQRAADDARDMANQEAISQNQPAPYAAAPAGQPIIINQQPTATRDDGGFWQGLVMGHLFSNYHTREPQTYTRRYNTQRNVTNVTNVRNVTNVQRQQPVTNTYKSGIKPTPAPQTWSQPSTTARSYNVQAPAPSTMKQKTWATSSSKGWGTSSGSYKTKSTGYTYKSSGYRSSYSRGRR